MDEFVFGRAKFISCICASSGDFVASVPLPICPKNLDIESFGDSLTRSDGPFTRHLGVSFVPLRDPRLDLTLDSLPAGIFLPVQLTEPTQGRRDAVKKMRRCSVQQGYDILPADGQKNAHNMEQTWNPPCTTL